jgi:DNA-binding NarL/FixJ family response regulator
MREFASSNDPGSREGEKPDLSSREREIVVWTAEGFKSKEIAEKLLISEQTVKNHLHNIFRKLGVSDRLELALYAIEHNIRPLRQLVG